MIRKTNSVARKYPLRRFEQLEQRYLLAAHFIDFSMLEPTDYTDSEILVRFKDHVEVESLNLWSGADLPGQQSSVLNAPLGEGFQSDSQLWEMPVLPGQSVEEMVHYYNSLDLVDFAEPNYRMQSAAIPNDQFYGVLWGMQDINAESAWDTRTDSSSIIVGVIDSGVEYDHPDLINNVWTNSGEVAGNGIDDDGNGYIDDFYGYDFDNDDADPRDDNGHGTHVAGTIGASGNNSIGVTGVGWNASIMALKVIGNGSNADVARAIDYATDNGAKITNNSYGYAGNNVSGSQTISNAVGRAKDAGVLYIVAAGNSRSTTPASNMDGSFNSWPAELSKVHDNVITVAATDSDGSFASYSHWGTESVQIAAPGTRIGSTYLNGGYVYSSGTSMAAPHVAGAAALLWAERPELSYLEIKDAMLDTARPEHLNLVGRGTLDLNAAMDSITSGNQNQSPIANNDTSTLLEDTFVSISVLNNDTDPDGDTLNVISVTQGSNGSVSQSGNSFTYTPNANYNGSDSFTYTIGDGNGGSDSATVNLTITPVNDNPIANDDSASTSEDTAVTVNLINNDDDIDGDNLFIQSVTDGANGSVTNNGNGTVTYTPNNGFFGSDTFIYAVSDGTASDTAQVSVNITEVTRPPVAVDDSSTISEDGQAVIPVLDNDSDPDGDLLSIQSFTQGTHGSVARNGESIIYTPSQNYNGRDSFTYTINDGTGLTDTATVRITITAVNDNPVANSDSASVLQGESVIVNVIANDSDIDGDRLFISQVSNPLNGTVINNGNGTISYTPFATFFGEDSFTYTVSDGSLTDTATVKVTVDEAVAGDNPIGYSGIAVDVTHVWKTIKLPMSFTNPVVVAGGATRDGGHQGVVRLRNVTSNSFQIRFQEWDYRDGRHTTENMGFMVLEAGIHELTDGTQLVATTINLTNESTRSVDLGTTFSTAPLVLGQVMTNNDPAAVTERIRNISTTGLQIQLNEEEAADGVHSTEVVGVVAIDTGLATSGEISINAIKTGDSVTQRNSRINFGAIGDSTSPVIITDMQTRDGVDTATVRHRSQTSTSVTVFIEEEASRDTELGHTTEVVGVLALEEGILFGTSNAASSSSSNGGTLGSKNFLQSNSATFEDFAFLTKSNGSLNDLLGGHRGWRQSTFSFSNTAQGKLFDNVIDTLSKGVRSVSRESKISNVRARAAESTNSSAVDSFFQALEKGIDSLGLSFK